MKQKWEYWTDTFTTRYPESPSVPSDYLNSYGQQGWELIALTATVTPDGYMTTQIMIFKRPINN